MCMTMEEIVEGLKSLASVNELSVVSDGGYYYLVVDEHGKPISPSALGLKLSIEGGEYCRLSSNIYTRTVQVVSTNDPNEKNDVEGIFMSPDKKAGIISGDVYQNVCENFRP